MRESVPTHLAAFWLCANVDASVNGRVRIEEAKIKGITFEGFTLNGM
jgi:hypothetical protein